MAKHTQTIPRQFANELFECVWPFCGIGAWKVKFCKIWYLCAFLSDVTEERTFPFNFKFKRYGFFVAKKRKLKTFDFFKT